jgi:hypothetical protein
VQFRFDFGSNKLTVLSHLLLDFVFPELHCLLNLDLLEFLEFLLDLLFELSLFISSALTHLAGPAHA